MTRSLAPAGSRHAWPELPWRDWEPTRATIHMWLQVVGKVRMALAPPLNHWWHITLYLSSRGLTTSPIPRGDGDFQVDFDFVDHHLRVTGTDAAVQDFFESAYEAGADLGGWDRAALEPAVPPLTPPTRPWSTTRASGS